MEPVPTPCLMLRSTELLGSTTSLLRSGGWLAPVAFYKQSLDIDLNELVVRELNLVGGYGYGPEFAEALALMTVGRTRRTQW